MNAQAGEVYEITVLKNGAYNNWTAAVRADGAAPTQAMPAGGGSISAKPAYTPAAKSTYETPEERAKKQIYIVRQSSISNAVDLLTTGAKTPPALNDVLSTAKAFEDYVFNMDGGADSGSDGFKDLDTLDDPLPY